tara:strand:- start:146 stop:373 length:228 start_codon:yes stop_codon:yes gene_type:complete
MISYILVSMGGIIIILIIIKIISNSTKHREIIEVLENTNLILESELGDVKNHLLAVKMEIANNKNEIIKNYNKTK